MVENELQEPLKDKRREICEKEINNAFSNDGALSPDVETNFPNKGLKYLQEIRQYLESTREKEAIKEIKVLEQILCKKINEEPSKQSEVIDLFDKLCN